MIVSCVVEMTKDLNQIPAENGMSTTISPHILITSRSHPYYLQINKWDFENYAQAYISKGKNNTNKARDVDVKELNLSDNE